MNSITDAWCAFVSGCVPKVQTQLSPSLNPNGWGPLQYASSSPVSFYLWFSFSDFFVRMQFTPRLCHRQKALRNQ